MKHNKNKNKKKGQGKFQPNQGREFKHDNFHHSKRRFRPKINLREDEVYITEFVTEHAGFTGVVKSRYSDFQVNEIDLNGQVLHLTDITVPKEEVEEISGEAMEAAKAELKTWIPEEKWAELVKLDEAKGDTKNIAPIEIDVSEVDKESRTKMHGLLKQIFGGRILGSTVVDKDDESKKTFRIKKQAPGRGGDQRWSYPGEFVHFLVHKTNLSTTDVASAIANGLNLRPSQVNYSGTKDKRAMTTQKFAIKRRRPEQIVRTVTKIRDVHVGNFEFSQETLKLGDLKGNRFRIALRHVDGEQELIELALEQLRENGFINYFGLQRFGNSAAVPTYEVGAALLKSDYKLAAELILKPRENDMDFMRKIREFWWETRDSAAAASKFRNDRLIEKKLLSGLAEYGEKDYASALRKIPRNLLTLYPHAFQSLIFNKVASRRIKEFGLKVIVGDLVYRDKNEADVDLTIEETERSAEEATDEQESTEVDKPDEAETENATEAAEKNGNEEAAATEEESIFKRKVKALTEEDIAANEYSVFDVVLPIPGFDITYPNNVVSEWYEEFLGEHGLSSEKLRHKVKTFSMPGAYRKLFIQPTEMSWKFVNYNKPEDTLIASDWEVLNKQEVEIDAKDGKLRALLLDFRLPTSTYATMLLRELLRADTSPAHQTQLETQERDKMSKEKEEAKDEEEKEQEENEKNKSNEEKSSNVPEKRKADEQETQDEAVEAKKVKETD